MNSSKKKIAIYATNASQYHVPIYKALNARQNIDLTVLYASDVGIESFYDEQSNAHIEWDIDLSAGYKYELFKNLSSRKNRGFFRAINLGIISYLILNKYDLILIQGYNTLTSWLVFFTSKIMGYKIAWRGEAIIPKDNQRTPFFKFKSFILQNYFRCFDHIFYSCNGNKLYLEQFISDQRKMSLFPCAVDNDYFHKIKKENKHKRDDLRKYYSIRHDEIVLLFAARFIERKRPYDLINALKDIDDKKLVVLFCGDGPERERMEKEASKLSVRSIFTGFLNQNQLAKHYLISDIYTILSEYDASPKTLNEALNFGLPVIASDMLGNAEDLILENENGFIVSVGDIDEIKYKLKYLLLNLDEFKEKSEVVTEKILSKWSIHSDVKALEEVIYRRSS